MLSRIRSLSGMAGMAGAVGAARWARRTVRHTHPDKNTGNTAAVFSSIKVMITPGMRHLRNANG
jgi:hypothetical protein